MREVLATAEPVEMIWEAFGGTGQTARVIRELHPGARLLATELDGACALEYNRNVRGGHCMVGDAREAIRELRPPASWGVSLDYNRFTLLDLRGRREGRWKLDLLEAVVSKDPRWIQFTDSAICYLKTNFRSYGLKSPDPQAYDDLVYRELHRRWGMVPGRRAAHSRATYYRMDWED